MGVARGQLELGRQLGMIRGVDVPASRVERLADADLVIERRSGSETELLEALSNGAPPVLGVMTRMRLDWSQRGE